MGTRGDYRLFVVLAVHVAIDLALLLFAKSFSHLTTWAVVALPVSQNSLVAIWACAGPGRLLPRMLLWPLGLLASWGVFIGLVLEHGTSEMAAGWGAGWLVQGLAIGTVLGILRLAHPHAAPPTFTLRGLLLMALVMSVALTIFRMVVARLGWGWEVFSWPHLMGVQALMLLSAGYALVVHWFLANNHSRVAAIMSAVLGVVTLCLASAYVIPMFVDSGDYTLLHASAFAAVQTASLIISLMAIGVHGQQRCSGPDQ